MGDRAVDLDRAARQARLLRRHITAAKRIARYAAEAPPPPSRIYGEVIVADLGGRVLGMISVNSEAGRIADDVELIRGYLGLPPPADRDVVPGVAVTGIVGVSELQVARLVPDEV